MKRRAPQSGKVLDPAWRRARALKANKAMQATYARQRRERGERYATKADAYAAGDRQGYKRACTWWSRKYRRDMAAALKGRAA